jgi:hypothetical protein
LLLTSIFMSIPLLTVSIREDSRHSELFFWETTVRCIPSSSRSCSGRAGLWNDYHSRVHLLLCLVKGVNRFTLSPKDRWWSSRLPLYTAPIGTPQRYTLSTSASRWVCLFWSLSNEVLD